MNAHHRKFAPFSLLYTVLKCKFIIEVPSVVCGIPLSCSQFLLSVIQPWRQHQSRVEQMGSKTASFVNAAEDFMGLDNTALDSYDIIDDEVGCVNGKDVLYVLFLRL